MTVMKVRDLMTDEVRSVQRTDSLAAVYDLMDEQHIRHVPVVDENRRLVGILSNRDLIRATVNGAADLPLTAQRQMLETMRAEEIMNTAPETIDPNADIREAAETLLEYKLGCLPVTDGDSLVGIITEADFVRRVAEL